MVKKAYYSRNLDVLLALSLHSLLLFFLNRYRYLEVGIYRDNLLPIIIIAHNGFNLLITDIASVISLLSPINYCDKPFLMHTVFKVTESVSRRNGKNTLCP